MTWRWFCACQKVAASSLLLHSCADSVTVNALCLFSVRGLQKTAVYISLIWALNFPWEGHSFLTQVRCSSNLQLGICGMGRAGWEVEWTDRSEWDELTHVPNTDAVRCGRLPIIKKLNLQYWAEKRCDMPRWHFKSARQSWLFSVSWEMGQS